MNKNPISAPAGQVTKNNTQGEKKAKRIVLGIDVHRRGYQVARKEDNLAIGPVQSFRSQPELLLYIEKLCKRAEQIEVVYEAGPLGYTLYRELSARGISCRVCAADNSPTTSPERKRSTKLSTTNHKPFFQKFRATHVARKTMKSS